MQQRDAVLPKQPQPIWNDPEADDEVFSDRSLVFQGVKLPPLTDEQAQPLDEKPPLEGPVVEAPYN